MKWHLIKILINPSDQLEFEFMNDGYSVWASGDTKKDVMKNIKSSLNRSDLKFTYMGPKEIIYYGKKK